MLLQARVRTFRLVRQHDHAMAAGETAHAWRGAGSRGCRTGGPKAEDAPVGRGLPLRLVLAVALHDVAWRELDRRPRLDPERGRPFRFDRHPLGEKLEAYRRGLDEMEAVDPWVGLLGSLHYSSFVGEERAGSFLRREEARRRRLRSALASREARDGAGASGPEGAAGGEEGVGAGERDGGPERDRAGVDARARRWLAWLKLFDGLSLRLCLAPPDVRDGSVPPWMSPGEPLEPPAGAPVELRWRGPDRAVLDPFPLRGPLVLEIPVRDLPARRYAAREELAEAWEAVPERTWRLSLSPPDG